MVLLILACLPAFVYGQLNGGQIAGAAYRGADGVQHDYLVYDGKGEPIQVNDHSNIGGTPFLQSDWAYATIKLTDGRSFSDSMVNYSLYNDQLYFKRDDRIYQIQFPVKEFLIECPGQKNDRKFFHYQNGFPEVGKNDNTTFYQVLFTGEKMQLLKWEHKQIRENYNYNGPYESNYTPVFEYFIYYPQQKRIASLGSKPDVKRIGKEIPEYVSEIDDYSAANKINTRKEDNLVKLISALDTAKQ